MTEVATTVGATGKSSKVCSTLVMARRLWCVEPHLTKPNVHVRCVYQVAVKFLEMSFSGPDMDVKIVQVCLLYLLS